MLTDGYAQTEENICILYLYKIFQNQVFNINE